MARDDGKRYGAGGALIETFEPQVEETVAPKKTTKISNSRRKGY